MVLTHTIDLGGLVDVVVDVDAEDPEAAADPLADRARRPRDLMLNVDSVVSTLNQHNVHYFVLYLL